MEIIHKNDSKELLHYYCVQLQGTCFTFCISHLLLLDHIVYLHEEKAFFLDLGLLCRSLPVPALCSAAVMAAAGSAAVALVDA